MYVMQIKRVCNIWQKTIPPPTRICKPKKALLYINVPNYQILIKEALRVRKYKYQMFICLKKILKFFYAHFQILRPPMHLST
jgi:hypothetical protein